jgi:hypothetical protein
MKATHGPEARTLSPIVLSTEEVNTQTAISLYLYMDATGIEIVVSIIMVNRRGHCCVQRGVVLQCCCASIEVPSPASRQKSCSCRVVHADICVQIPSS